MSINEKIRGAFGVEFGSEVRPDEDPREETRTSTSI